MILLFFVSRNYHTAIFFIYVSVFICVFNGGGQQVMFWENLGISSLLLNSTLGESRELCVYGGEGIESVSVLNSGFWVVSAPPKIQIGVIKYGFMCMRERCIFQSKYVSVLGAMKG